MRWPTTAKPKEIRPESEDVLWMAGLRAVHSSFDKNERTNADPPSTVAEADAIVRYLGVRFTVPGPPRRTVGPFLRIQPEHIKTENGLRFLVDPWGNPYHAEIYKNPSSSLVHFRVWSLGPDGQEGPVPFSRVEEITDPRDRDNIRK